MRGEFSRKFIHIGSGILIATMPAYMNRYEIIVTSGLFFLGLVVLSGFLHWFKSIEDVKRVTWGQYIYPLSVMLLAFMFEDPLIFSFAVLELAFADGLAAIVGSYLPHKKYHIPGGFKTYVGSGAFFMVSIVLLSAFVLLHGTTSVLAFPYIILVAIVMTFLEGIVAGGLDNFVVPISMGLMLSLL